MDKAQHSPKKPSAPIPEDFDIAKYGLVKDVSRWKDALARRVILQNNLHTLSDLLAECAQQGESSEFREGLCSGSRTNIQNKVLISLSEPIPLKKESFNPSNCEGIKSNVINGEKEKVEEKLEPFFFNGYNKLTDKKLYLELHKPISGTLYFDERWPPETRTPNSPAEVVIKVNLYHNDNVLIESFSEWLKEMRELYFPVAGKKNVDTKRIEEWHRMRILPYMDLWLYEQAFDVEFDRKAIAKCLFENDSDGNAGFDYDKRLRNTEERAKHLIQESVFFSLRFEET